jgi:hypothetical protein
VTTGAFSMAAWKGRTDRTAISPKNGGTKRNQRPHERTNPLGDFMAISLNLVYRRVCAFSAIQTENDSAAFSCNLFSFRGDGGIY